MKGKMVSVVVLTILLTGMLALAFNIQSAKAEPVPYQPSGMVSYWKFDEGAGMTAFDSVGQNDGTIYGATWNTGIVGSALSFDGVDDYVLIPDKDSLRFSGNGTLELWMRQSGIIGTLVWKRIYAGSYGWTMYLGFPNTVIGYVNDWADWVEATVSPDEWQHIALVYELGMIKLYVNGVLKDTESNPLGFQPTSVNLYIGRDEIGNYFDGLIDEVAIYSVALSASEIQQHYQNGLKGLGYPLTWTVDDDGPADFHTIQEAINAASAGDTVYVYNGTYYECVNIGKSLKLIGQSPSITIIDASTTAPTVVSINSNNVEVSGFTIKGGYSSGWYFIGVMLWSSSGCNISGNTIIDNVDDGIYFPSSSGNVFSNNIIANNGGEGMYSGFHSSNNIISGNTIANNSGYGVWLDQFSSNNIIFHNNLINNTAQARNVDSINVWDDGYPSGGNYWSDYVKRYPDAAELDGSGIWDTPYVIDENNQDNYPLMEPWSPAPPVPTTIDELKTKIEELGSEGEIDNHGIVKSLIVKLNTAQKLVDKGKTEEAKSILEDDFIPQVQNLSGIHITTEAADILIESAEHIISNL